MSTLKTLDAWQDETLVKPLQAELDARRTKPSNKHLVIGASTSAGKTYVTINKIIPLVINRYNSNLFVYTTPNLSSLVETGEAIHNLYGDDYYIRIIDGFAGQHPHDIGEIQQSANLWQSNGKPVIIVCHPTTLSSNDTADYFKTLFKNSSNPVVLSDEAHKGFMCKDADDTEKSYGFPMIDFSGEWYNFMETTPTFGWVLLTATIRDSIREDKSWKILTEGFDKDILCLFQKAVRSITVYGTPDTVKQHDWINYTSDDIDPGNINKEWHEKEERLKDIQSRYPSFPNAKIVRLSKGTNKKGSAIYHEPKHRYSSDILFDKYGKNGKSCVNISGHKQVHGGKKNMKGLNSPKLVNQLNDISSNTNDMFANHNIGEAINVLPATMLNVYQEHKSSKDSTITVILEQLLGRMLRFQNVDGLNSWQDVIDLKHSLINNHNVPKNIINEWIELVFMYDIHIIYSENNHAGLLAFCSKQTLNPNEWKAYIDNLSNIIDFPRKPNSGASMGQIQGSRKHVNEYCEECPIENNGKPRCYNRHMADGYDHNSYQTHLVGHHIDHNHNNDISSNVKTMCTYTHDQHHYEINELVKYCKG